jgi:hypothetical protein
MFTKWLRARNGSRQHLSQTGRKGRQRGGSSPLRVELLEDRTLLSAPASVTSAFSGTGGQLGYNQTAGSVGAFLGDSFDKSTSVGHISHNLLGSFGAEGNLDISGEAGIQFDASVNSGTAAAAFNEVLNQNYAEPTMFNQVVNFAPTSGTGVSYLSSGGTGFSTMSPSVGASASLELGLHTTLGAHFALFDTFGGEASFGGDVSIPLFSFNQNNDQEVKIFSVPVTSGVTGQLVNGIAGLDYPLFAEPVPTKLHVSFENQNLDFLQSLFLEAYPPPAELKPEMFTAEGQAPGDLANLLGGPSANDLKGSIAAGLELGSLEEKVPQITVSSSSLQPDGSLSASTSVNVADLNLEMGPLAGLLMPALAPVTEGIDTFRLRLTPGVSVDFTPISFQLTPALDIGQTATVVPMNTLTYQFQDPSTGMAVSPDVFLNGVDQGHTNTISFRPGIDTLSSSRFVPRMESAISHVGIGRFDWISSQIPNNASARCWSPMSIFRNASRLRSTWRPPRRG